MVDSNFNVDWFNENVEKVPNGGQGMYRLLCAVMLKKRLTYRNLYVFAYALNKHKFKDNETRMKQMIIEELAKIYYFNTGKLPIGIEFNEKD
jgi:hypothetical protein